MSLGSGSIPSRPQSPQNVVPDIPSTSRPYRFTWDLPLRTPGPESVSGTTDGRGGGDHFSAQPRITLPGASSSFSLPLDATISQDWSSAKHGFHAISTVVNNPHKWQAPPKAHSLLPGVAFISLPRVRRKDFNSYLRTVAPGWERFQQICKLKKGGISDVYASLGTSKDQENDKGPLSNNHPSSTPTLDSIPTVFFEQDFNISNPKIFSMTTENRLSCPSSLINLSSLLEKFSLYADTVEQHLIHEISLRSTSFFAALTNLRDLQSQSEACLTRITSLRTTLITLDDNYAIRGLGLVRQHTCSINMLQVIDGVKLIGGVADMNKVAKGLLNVGQWAEALVIIKGIEQLWNKRTDLFVDGVSTTLDGNGHSRDTTAFPFIPLSSLHAYAYLPNHLQSLTLEVAESLSTEVIIILRTNLYDRTSRSRDCQLDCAGDIVVDQRNIEDGGLRKRLRTLVLGLVQTKGLKDCILSWRDVALAEVITIVKSRLPFLNDEDLEGATHSLSGHPDTSSMRSKESTPRSSVDLKPQQGLNNPLRSMQQKEFMILLLDLYRAMHGLVKEIKGQVQLMEEVLDDFQVPRSSFGGYVVGTALVPLTIQDELSDVLSSVAELSNTQAARIISLRVEEHTSLELADFMVLFNESWAFVVKCEVLCQRMIVSLRGVVISQAKQFLHSFHHARLTRSAKIVEDELWNPVEITPSLQRIANVIVDSADQDVPELVSESGDSHGTHSELTISTMTTNAKHLRIEGRIYFAVLATTEMLSLLLDYLRLVVNLSMLATDAMSRVIEFLKAFNSRTCQVVLGAGAMRSAGLKNITAKHLALASQSLSIVSELIPYLREMFRRYLNPSHAVMLIEFDKLKRDYQEHQNEIHAKLIAIMGDRLTAHIKSLQAVDWNLPDSEGGVNNYMEILVKETVTLHKVLSRYLSTQVVEYVMTQVFAAINHGLSEEYNKIELPNQVAKTRLLDDALYLHQKLSALNNISAFSNMPVMIVSEKSITQPAPLRTPSRSNTIQNVGASANLRLKGLLSPKSQLLPARTDSLSHVSSLKSGSFHSGSHIENRSEC